MYAIYAGGVCIYNDINPADDLHVVNPELTLSDNAAGSLTMTLPPTNVGYSTIERMITDITVKKDDEEIWMGRVLSESKDFWNNRVLYCEGELAFFNDSVQPPKKYTSLTIRNFLANVLNVHNAKVAANRRFQLGIVTVYSDGSNTEFSTNYEKTMEVINSLVDTFGGHLRIRKVGNTRYLDYLKTYPNTCQQVIEFGVNLIDFTKSWDMTEFATVIIPLGARLNSSSNDGLDEYVTVASVNDDSIYVQSETVDTYGYIEKTVTWDDITDPNILLSKAQAYLTEMQFDNMVLEMSALDMHYLNPSIEDVKLLDEIQVQSTPHGLGIDKTFPVTQLKIPLDSPEKTTFTLGGTVQTSLTTVNNQTSARILEKIEAIPNSLLAEARTNATAIMDDALTGYVTIVKGNNGTEAIYITNTPNYETATKLWKWGMGGLGYLDKTDSSYYNAATQSYEYVTAMTMDGSIVADRITTGILNADLIRAGVIQDDYDFTLSSESILDNSGNVVMDNSGNAVVDHITSPRLKSQHNVIFDLREGSLRINKGFIGLGAINTSVETTDPRYNHYNFEVDDQGNLIAGSGVFAGQLVAASGSFYGVVQAQDFLDSNGNSLLVSDTDYRLKSSFLQLPSLTIQTATNNGETTTTLSLNGVSGSIVSTSATQTSTIVNNAISGITLSVSKSTSSNETTNTLSINGSSVDITSITKTQAQTIAQDVNAGITLSVTNGATSSTITLSGAGITSQSKSITFTGVVTFSALLSNDTTTNTLIEGGSVYVGETLYLGSTTTGATLYFSDKTYIETSARNTSCYMHGTYVFDNGADNYIYLPRVNCIYTYVKDSNNQWTLSLLSSYINDLISSASSTAVFG